MKILGLELGLPEAPLQGPWGVIWRSAPPVLSWSPQRVNSHPGWPPAPLLPSGGWAGWWEGGQPSALRAWNGLGNGGGSRGPFVLLQDAAPEPSPF